MKLKVGVLVKQVPDHETIIQIKSENELDIEDRYVCSFFDEIAIEAALNIKKNHPDTEIFAISAGGKKMVDALRRAISMGIDQVEHVGDEIIDCNGGSGCQRYISDDQMTTVFKQIMSQP